MWGAAWIITANTNNSVKLVKDDPFIVNSLKDSTRVGPLIQSALLAAKRPTLPRSSPVLKVDNI